MTRPLFAEQLFTTLKRDSISMDPQSKRISMTQKYHAALEGVFEAFPLHSDTELAQQGTRLLAEHQLVSQTNYSVLETKLNTFSTLFSSLLIRQHLFGKWEIPH